MESNTSHQVTFASFYDFYDDPEYRQDELQMYRDLASEAEDSVLELACGTGVITIQLARTGLRVTGLDISPDMLQVAQKKVLQEDPDVRSRISLVEADMKDFKLNDMFDGVFIPNNSFGCLTALADQKTCLQTIHEHLDPQGLMVIEERNYTPKILMEMLQRRAAITVHRAAINPATGKYTTYNSITHNIDFVTQTIYSRQFIDEIQDDGTVKRYIRTDGGVSRAHYFNQFELRLLIEQAGFVVKALYGDAKEILTAESYSMIFVAEKK